MNPFMERIKRADPKILIIIMVCLLLEIFVCNGNSFQVLDKQKYERKSFTVDQMETTGFEVEGNILTYVEDYGEEASITIKNIDTCVGTIFLDLYLPDSNYLGYTVYYTDEANQYPQLQYNAMFFPGIPLNDLYSNFCSIATLLLVQSFFSPEIVRLRTGSAYLSQKSPFAKWSEPNFHIPVY